MNITVNAVPHNVTATILAEILVELGYANPATATALNGQFVPRTARDTVRVSDGDQLEILAPMQGG
ncbi:sulfur carrier protein ThiS [Aestuariibius sp. HNIBRBA575]|uniref:sulfur carrier protein ThiS n=1 Tax=Aestuariibius sp. HNIBRBA575 TaxID=3233343 RepID=UPI0034A593CE